MHDVCCMIEKRVRRLMLTLRKTLKRECLACQARNAEIRLPSLFQDPVQRALRRRKDENERLRPGDRNGCRGGALIEIGRNGLRRSKVGDLAKAHLIDEDVLELDVSVDESCLFVEVS